eukprot:TRINITY_DN83946_c0_g1_i1.p1 TRINITY_DN83946_c0_g1~~TRINITY_DN83946_c0_g1_i1.p1  ORF type:complete len:257 (-),score=68.47 TRINITY_DN83946_c0_g1_i1:128-898(-)
MGQTSAVLAATGLPPCQVCCTETDDCALAADSSTFAEVKSISSLKADLPRRRTASSTLSNSSTQATPRDEEKMVQQIQRLQQSQSARMQQLQMEAATTATDDDAYFYPVTDFDSRFGEDASPQRMQELKSPRGDAAQAEGEDLRELQAEMRRLQDQIQRWRAESEPLWEALEDAGSLDDPDGAGSTMNDGTEFMEEVDFSTSDMVSPDRGQTAAGLPVVDKRVLASVHNTRDAEMAPPALSGSGSGSESSRVVYLL